MAISVGAFCPTTQARTAYACHRRSVQIGIPIKLDKVAYIRVKIVPPTISNVVGVKGCPQQTRMALKIPKPTIAAIMSRRYPVTLTPKGGRSSSSSSLLQVSSSEAAPSNREVEGDLSLVGKPGSDVGMNRMKVEEEKGVVGWT